ncbi:MAG: molybdopterin-dependent oxidoreductase [Thermoleophilia bacterium]|nr:molybdopterin-dependent oxidoreductase [Thermoleophilia bacterium]
MESNDHDAPLAHAPDGPAEVSAWERPIGRRAFLATVASGIGALFVLSRFGDVTRAVSRVTESVKPGGGWRIYAVESPMPVFEPDDFTLKITGEVENPVELSWDEVQSWASNRLTSDFHCVTGWSVMDVKWQGILPSEIIERVKPKPSAKFVSMLSLERSYMDQVTMEQFTVEGNVLAHTMDGLPLTREHGSPLRMVLPEMYGYKGVKWVRELRFDSEMMPGYWEQRGYDVDAYVGRSNGINI